MGYTISTHCGSVVSFQHNYNKDFRNKEEHISKDREIKVLEYTPIRDKYELVFGEAIQEYNSNQKRKDRQIDSYYDKIKNDKMKKNCYEMIVQIGNYENKPSEELQEEILKDFYEEFKEKYPNMEIVGATIHCDEGVNDEGIASLHMHLDFIPIKHSNKGLKISVSMSGACEEMGFINLNNKFNESGLIQWTKDVNKTLENICIEKYGLEIVHPQRNINEEQKALHSSIKEYRDSKIKEEIEINKSTLNEQKITININGNTIQSQNDLISQNNEEIAKKKKILSLVDVKFNEEKERYSKRIEEIKQEGNNKIIEFKNKYDKVKGEYENMCFNLNQKKKELDNIIVMPTHSIRGDFLSMGKEDMLGNRKFTKQEWGDILQNIDKWDSKLDNYNNTLKGLRERENALIEQVEHKKKEVTRLKEQITNLEGERNNLLYYESYVNEKDNIIDFERFKSNKTLKFERDWGGYENIEVPKVVNKVEHIKEDATIHNNKDKDRAISF